MAKQLFSVPIFFILFRETLEASIICSVLLAMVEQIVRSGQYTQTSTVVVEGESESKATDASGLALVPAQEELTPKRLIRKLRIQIFGGAAVGLLIALAIGAAFIAVYFTEVKDLWSQSEELWEGIFSLIAALMIFVMALAMLKMDRAQAKWRYKLKLAFEKQHSKADRAGMASKYALFILPLVTVLREGLEAVVFVGGVALGQDASSIPIAAIVGIIAGLIVGFIIYFSSRKINISIFLVISTTFLLFIGAGLFSKSAQFFYAYSYIQLVGGDAAESGDGPGSFDVRGVVWHLDCCSPENKFDAYGWGIFNAIFGWNNTAYVGTILTYIFFWLAIIVALVAMKWKEGRIKIFGKESAIGRERRLRREAKAEQVKRIEGQHSPSVGSTSSKISDPHPAA